MAKERVAKISIVEEFRNMEVGDSVYFPLDRYKYNTIRATPSTSLVAERCEGKQWRTRADFANKRVEVIRIS